MICKKMLLSFVYLCFVLSTKEERALNQKENPKKEDQVFEDNNTGHIIYSNVPEYLMQKAIHYDPRLELFFKFSREFLINSYNETTTEALKNLKTNIKKSKNKFYKEYDIYEMYYKECLEIFSIKISDLFLHWINLNKEELRRCKKYLKDLQKKILSKFPIESKSGTKVSNEKINNSKGNKNKIEKIYSELSKNESIETFIFSQLAFFYDCVLSEENCITGSCLSPLPYLLSSSKLNEVKKDAVRPQRYFELIRDIYSVVGWNYSQNVFEKTNEISDNKQMNKRNFNGLSGLRKSLFRDFKIPFEGVSSSIISIYDQNYSIILLNGDFPDCIFTGENIFPIQFETTILEILNISKTIKISIILQSEYSLMVFIKYIINFVKEEYFYKIFILKDIFKKNSERRKLINSLFSSIKKVEPFYREISVGLYNTLSKISVDAHIVFVFHKLDSRLFPFIQKEILLAINSSDLKVKVKENVFSNPEIFNVFFDLYKLCFVESTSKYKTLENVREVKFIDLND